MKQRALILQGVGKGDKLRNVQMKKEQLIKRLTNKGYNLQMMTINSIRKYLKSERVREEKERLEIEHQIKEKDKILKRIMNSNMRLMGIGFRQSIQFMKHDRERERAHILKQTGIMRRIIDKNTRMASAAYNKLIEKYKIRQDRLKEKLKYVIKALTDKDTSYMLTGYNSLKQRAMMLKGVGMGDAEIKKLSLIKRLTNKGYNLQMMTINSIREYLKSERVKDET